jgi:phospholipid/cholesterol/gamma-HCH transport system substrate-binding protein
MKSEQVNYVIVGVFVLTMLTGIVVSVALLTGRTGGTESYFTSYRDVTGLKFGSPVLYMGFPVGQVESISPELEDGGLVFNLELKITEQFRTWNVPKDSVARIKAAGLLAAITVDIRAGESTEWLKPNDHILGEEGRDIFGAVSDTANALKRLTENRLEPLLTNLNVYVNSLGQVLTSDGTAAIKDVRVFTHHLATRAPELIDNFVALTESVRQTSDSLGIVLSPGNADKLDGTVDNVLLASQELAAMSTEVRGNLNALIGPKSQGRVNVMIDNLSLASANIATLSENLDARLGDVLTPAMATKIQRALDNFAVAANNVAQLTNDLHGTRRKVDELFVSLNAITEENRPDIRAAVSDLRHTLRSLSQNVDAITYNLEGTSRNLVEFSRIVRDNPSVLLRGTSKTQDGPGEGG